MGLKELKEDKKVENEPSKDEKLKALYDKMLREDPHLKEHSVTFEQLRPRLEHMLREDEAERSVEKKDAQNEQKPALVAVTHPWVRRCKLWCEINHTFRKKLEFHKNVGYYCVSIGFINALCV